LLCQSRTTSSTTKPRSSARRGDAIGGDEVVEIFEGLWDATRFDKQRYAALRDAGRDMMKRYGDSPVWRESELELIEHEFHGLQIQGHPFDGKIDRVRRAGHARRHRTSPAGGLQDWAPEAARADVL